MPRGVPKSGHRVSEHSQEIKLQNDRVSSVIDSFLHPENDKPKFTVNQRFDFLTKLTKMVAKFQTPSLICSGAGGLGKSYTIMKTLEDMGLMDVSLLDSKEPIPSSYRVVKGASTPLGLYRILYENRDSIVILDDCDRVFSDSISVNLLKGALDSNTRRVISWKSERMSDDLPSVFEYNGGVIIITNVESDKLDGAVRTRSMIVDLSMNNLERIERMKTLIESENFMPDNLHHHKMEALELIKTLSSKLKELSLRTLIKTIKIRAANPDHDWKDLATYMLVSV